MTPALFKYTLTVVLAIFVANSIVWGDKTSTPNPSDRFLKHIFRKYGSRGTISFEVIQ